MPNIIFAYSKWIFPFSIFFFRIIKNNRYSKFIYKSSDFIYKEGFSLPSKSYMYHYLNLFVTGLPPAKQMEIESSKVRTTDWIVRKVRISVVLENLKTFTGEMGKLVNHYTQNVLQSWAIILRNDFVILFAKTSGININFTFWFLSF